MAKCIRCGKEKSYNTRTQYCKSCGCIVKRSTPEYIAHLKSRKPPMLGKKHSEESKEKMKAKFNRGDKHYNWKGGKAKCIDCGKTLSTYNKSVKRCQTCSLKLQKGVNHPWFGRKHTPETIAKIKATETGRPRPDLRGENHYAWKGGISPLATLIRYTIPSVSWKKSVLSRDGYTCCECGVYSGHLVVHHITPFKELIDDFLKEYSQFSPMEDKETLVRLSESYKPFFDVNNGITMCNSCHKKYHKNVNIINK